MPPLIHSTAKIADNVTVGENTRVEEGCVLHPPTRIGENCRIGADAELNPWMYLGDRVKIGPGARIHSGTEIEDEVTVEAGLEVGWPEENRLGGTRGLHKTILRRGTTASTAALAGGDTPVETDRKNSDTVYPYDPFR